MRRGWSYRHPPNIQFRLNRLSAQARGLVGWWPKYQLGLNLPDRSGYFRDATFTMTPTPTMHGVLGPVLDHDNGDYCSVSANLSSSEFTIAAWAVLDAYQPSSLYRYLAGRLDGFAWGVTPVNEGSDFGIWINSGGYTWYSAAFVATVGVPYHWCVTRNAASLVLYIDGIATNSHNTPLAPASNANATHLGAFAGGETWDGMIGDMRMYDRALSAAEVYQLYSPATRWELYEPVIPLWVVPFVATGNVLVEVVDETINIDEESQRNMGLLRQIAEGMSLLETILRARTMARFATDTIDINETPTRLMAMTRQTAEAVNIDEVAQRLTGLLRSIAETVNIDEAAARLRTYLRAIDETVNIDEVTQRLTGLLRSIGETINIDEAIVRARTLARIIGDRVNIDEAINRLKAMTRTVSETVNISETIVDVLTAVGNLLIHVIDEVVNVDEVTQRLMAMTRRIDETLNISETTSRAMTLVRRVAETVNIDEAINRAVTWIRTIDETVNITETIARIRGMSKVIDETVNISETVAGILGVVSGFIDATFKGMYRGMFRKMR